MPIDDELTYKIIGCAMEVHKIMGNSFQEVIYQRCLALELQNAGILFEREMDMTLSYKNVEVGTRRADFIVDGKVVVELKALFRIGFNPANPKIEAILIQTFSSLNPHLR